ncbi:MAG TPA: hypothetical protein EYG03_27625 [Planctomycetes bacterium]|nr:hypothetical protein [Fuerstiella sp.]HIK95733.1 hypothetical protein [Planctomycetota bacterium]
MQHSFRYLFLTGATLLTATGSAAEIQQVGFQNCPSGCCTKSCVASGGSRRCRQGDYCNNGQCRGNRCSQRSGNEDCFLVRCCKTKGSGDSGWSPPARLPVNRTGGWYQSYWPGKWYGNPGGGFQGGAPMVYQPTDTTQLGYSYNRVPTWRPNPGMIPRVPSPSNYHTRMCPGQTGCQIGTTIMYNGGSSCPTCNPGYVNTAAQRRIPQLAQAPQLAEPRQPQQSPSVSTVAQAIVPAQAITVPDSYTSLDIVTAEQPAALSANNTVRTISNTVTEKAASAGPNRPGKRVRKHFGSAQRRTKKTSGGWFGLPSLSEIRF